MFKMTTCLFCVAATSPPTQQLRISAHWWAETLWASCHLDLQREAQCYNWTLPFHKELLDTSCGSGDPEPPLTPSLEIPKQSEHFSPTHWSRCCSILIWTLYRLLAPPRTWFCRRFLPIKKGVLSHHAAVCLPFYFGIGGTGKCCYSFMQSHSICKVRVDCESM